MVYHSIRDAARLCQALGRADLNQRIIRSYVDRGLVPAYPLQAKLYSSAPLYMVNLDALLLMPIVPRRGKPSKSR